MEHVRKKRWSNSGPCQANIHPFKHKHAIMSRKPNGNNNTAAAVGGKSNTVLNTGLRLIEISQNRAALIFCLSLL